MIKRWGATVICGLIFLIFFSVRMDWLRPAPEPESKLSMAAPEDLSSLNGWMKIVHNGQPIGYAHTLYKRHADGFHFIESLFMRINTMGMVQDIAMQTSGDLTVDFSLLGFDFRLSSGRFGFSAAGTVSGDRLTVETETAGSTQTIEIALENPIFFTSGVIRAAASSPLTPGERFTMDIFDPVSLANEQVELTVVETEAIRVMGKMHSATKVSISYKGATQLAWIGDKGQILKEQGFMGIHLERTTREDALGKLPVQPGQDLTRSVSIAVDRRIDDPAALTRLEIEMLGAEDKRHLLDGGRQRYADQRLVIIKETLPAPDQSAFDRELTPAERRFTQADPFIQSDHPSIRRLAGDIVSGTDTRTQQIESIMVWMKTHIQKRPVVSLPNALSTLRHRVGDCNEHAVLFAALSRSIGIPTKVEAGVVYLDGRFYYHAWNLVYLGQWITVDPLFQQFPADATHIRLASGSQREQLDLMSLIGRLHIRIMDYRYD